MNRTFKDLDTTTKSQYDLTILTVNFHSDFLLRLNLDLLHKLNDDINIKWIITQNDGQILNKEIFKGNIEFLRGVHPREIQRDMV
jgi:hypothetical protein